MHRSSYIFTSESVSEGHPDKMADQVSDAILDAYITQDPYSRVACETLLTTGLVVVSGEITSTALVDVQEVVRQTVRGIGYTDSDMGFNADECGVIVCIHKQSSDIAMGVDAGEDKEQGAGDQGLMFGYAIDETPELMPTPIMYSHMLARRLATVRKEGTLPFLRPDGKSQVTVRYENNAPVVVDTIVVSSHHTPEVSSDAIHEGIMEEVIVPTIPADMMDGSTKVFINPTGRFEIGGPHGDTGLTGRKIIVDTYGGWARHGGGAFSGKDPSKVDRSAAYCARYIAKNVVAAGLAKQCEVQLAYAIGIAEPVSVMVDTFGTSTIPEEHIEVGIREVFKLSPGRLIEELDLLRPIFLPTAAYGHFGRDEETFTWERTDKVDDLMKALS